MHSRTLIINYDNYAFTLALHSCIQIMNKQELRSTRKCPLCDEFYNDAQNSPMQLPCSHNICKYCLASIQAESTFVQCALCCSCFPADSYFDTNAKILSVLKRLSSMQDYNIDSIGTMNLGNNSPEKNME